MKGAGCNGSSSRVECSEERKLGQMKSSPSEVTKEKMFWLGCHAMFETSG